MSKMAKAVLTKSAESDAIKACNSAADAFMAPDKQRSNVVGLGVGVKWTGGEPTGAPALVVLVSQKVEKSELSRADLVPAKLADMQTDVLEVGHLFAGDGGIQDAGIQTLTRRVRPTRGGYSVGHFRITAGTIATCVYDQIRGGVGIPPHYYILSNNHVLANNNDAALGDPILQPGPIDGGADPADRIARLSRFVPIVFEPAVPRDRHQNLVDAAIAVGEFHDLDREIYWTGHLRGWRRKADVKVGTVIQKTGRSTNYTLGRITAVNATVDVNFGAGRLARFRDQIITTNMSAPGDSGSLVTTIEDVAIGLLFAGSAQATILNQIENVRAALRIELAEQIL